MNSTHTYTHTHTHTHTHTQLYIIETFYGVEFNKGGQKESLKYDY